MALAGNTTLAELEQRCSEVELEVKALRENTGRLTVPVPHSLPPTKTSEATYLSLLAQTAALSSKLLHDRQRHAARVSDLQEQLEERRAKTQAVVNAFRELKRATCEETKKIPISVIHELEDFELEKEAELSEIRGAWISLTRKLKHLNRKLRQRDQLANNLHVVDFEQLKLENQSLNERIEGKLEEKSKGEHSLHSLLESHAHVAMRVHALGKATTATASEREALAACLLEVREKLIHAKKERHRLAVENADAKRRAKLKNDKALMEDYWKNKQFVQELTEDVERLTQEVRNLANI